MHIVSIYNKFGSPLFSIYAVYELKTIVKQMMNLVYKLNNLVKIKNLS